MVVFNIQAQVACHWLKSNCFASFQTKSASGTQVVSEALNSVSRLPLMMSDMSGSLAL
jgi:hypothetical protein